MAGRFWPCPCFAFSAVAPSALDLPCNPAPPASMRCGAPPPPAPVLPFAPLRSALCGGRGPSSPRPPVLASCCGRGVFAAASLPPPFPRTRAGAAPPGGGCAPRPPRPRSRAFGDPKHDTGSLGSPQPHPRTSQYPQGHLTPPPHPRQSVTIMSTPKLIPLPDAFKCPYSRACWQRELARYAACVLLAAVTGYLAGCSCRLRAPGFEFDSRPEYPTTKAMPLPD